MIPGTRTLRYRPDIDGLRAIAVVAVLLHHVWPQAVTGGFVGVDVFFVISGFLITSIIEGEIRSGTFSFASFYQRRARRLLPALFAMLAAVLGIGWFVLLPSDYLETFRTALGTSLFGANVVVWRDLAQGYFAPDAKLNPLLHTWSLGVEEQFYFFFPVFLVLCIRFFPAKLKPIVAGAILLSFGLSIVLLGDHPVAVFFLSPFRAWELLVGAALGLGMLPVGAGARWRGGAVAGGLGAIIFAAFGYSPATPFPASAALLPVLGAAAVIYGGGSGVVSGMESALSNRVIVYLGRISYSLYLWHWPIVVLATYVFQAEVGPWLGAGMIVISVALAAASHHFIERPFRLSRERAGRTFLARGLAFSAVFAAVSLIGVACVGFEGRVNSQARIFDRERNSAIAFKDCDRRRPWCLIGDASKTPTLLFWGDSHMLAWAPAIDRELKRAGLSGYFAVHSACPPAWGVIATGVPTCVGANDAVAAFFARSNSIDHVILAAHWNMYLKAGRVKAGGAGGDEDREIVILSTALDDTIRRLKSSGKAVSIIGSVPTYSRNVPFELASAQENLGYFHELEPSRDRLGPTLAELARKHDLAFVDPAASICAHGKCETQRNGRSLYRDDSHLSVAGALAYGTIIRIAVGNEHYVSDAAQGRAGK